MTLKKKWFDQIAFGIKKEEYREFKEYWFTRIVNREYDIILFRNGYAKNAPEMRVKYLGYALKSITWDSGVIEEVFALQLGRILELKNCQYEILSEIGQQNMPAN